MRLSNKSDYVKKMLFAAVVSVGSIILAWVAIMVIYSGTNLIEMYEKHFDRYIMLNWIPGVAGYVPYAIWHLRNMSNDKVVYREEYNRTRIAYFVVAIIACLVGELIVNIGVVYNSVLSAVMCFAVSLVIYIAGAAVNMFCFGTR